MGTVGGVPYYSYLNQLQGVADTIGAPVTPTKSTTPPATSSASSTSSQNNTAASLVSSLLNGGNSFSPEILSLLQQNSSGNFDPITSLLGGTSTNDPLTSILANLYAGGVASSLTQAQDNSAQQTADTKAVAATSPVQNLVNASAQASLAYNQTILQNAQNIINANSYQADGVTPLVA